MEISLQQEIFQGAVKKEKEGKGEGEEEKRQKKKQRQIGDIWQSWQLLVLRLNYGAVEVARLKR